MFHGEHFSSRSLANITSYSLSTDVDIQKQKSDINIRGKDFHSPSCHLQGTLVYFTSGDGRVVPMPAAFPSEVFPSKERRFSKSPTEALWANIGPTAGRSRPSLASRG
jgi:hypothetical protein